MNLIFKEDYRTTRGTEPGNWFVERNSDLPFSAYRCDGEKISLLSPGNKYIPLAHPFADGEIRFRLGLDVAAAGRADFQVCFRYDLDARRGESVRLYRTPETDNPEYFLETGTTLDNVFTPTASQKVALTDAAFEAPVAVRVAAAGSRIEFAVGPARAVFQTREAPVAGFAALARGPMYCLADVYDFEIQADLDDPEPKRVTDYRVTYPEAVVMHPITCSITLKDYGRFYEAELTIGGGVKTTPVGEGNYHGKRTDVLDRPYFKVITPERTEKFTLYNGLILWLKDEITPPYLFRTLHRKVDWPFRARLRFMKPETDFLFAVGADTFYNTTWGQHALSPGETLFTPAGKVVDSGLGLTEVPARIEFGSQKCKAILDRLPKDDPQIDKAVAFAENNHYFLEGETPAFSIAILSLRDLPETVEITLENAFFEPLRTVPALRTVSGVDLGVLRATRAVYTCRLEGLAPGLYHLRCRSTDASVPPIEDYCAFEVMSRRPDAPPAPLISGLPFLYTARTETRGLETDAFDPWHGRSVDDGHYMACTVFLPAWARAHRIAPTVHAYQRQWFLWTGTRDSDHPDIADNQDLIKDADFVNYNDEVGAEYALWVYRYRGPLIEAVLRFAEASGDPGFDLDELRKRIQRDEAIDLPNFTRLAEHHWDAWLEAYAAFQRPAYDAAFRACRALNPGIRYAGYGPGAIYASHYKGCEFVKYRPLIPPEHVGFWQYEDYPVACRYGIERGTYFLTACLMALPGARIYPEIYVGGGLGGCPDGAVNYAHPPYGIRGPTSPLTIQRRVYDYALASAHFTGTGFDYWREAGFQSCRFNRGQFEGLLTAWRVVRRHPPARPLRGPAFVYSEESWKADSGQTVIQDYGSIVDVRKTVAEDVPMAYEEARRSGLAAGFLLDMSAVAALAPNQVDTLVLPPLEGVSKKYRDAIRALHEQGVNLIAFENVTGLDDLFGVEDTGAYRRAIHFRTAGSFLRPMAEISNEPKCVGKYRAKDAAVLVESEIPVLMLNQNRRASAAFFNVPPTLVNDDRHVRLGYGRESISPIVRAALAEIFRRFSDAPAAVSAGRLIAYEAQGGETVLVAANPDEDASLSPVVTVRTSPSARRVAECDKPYTLLSGGGETLRVRLWLGPQEAAVLVLR